MRAVVKRMNGSDYDRLDDFPSIHGDDEGDKLLASRYIIIRKLGEGGMRMVHLIEEQ